MGRGTVKGSRPNNQFSRPSIDLSAVKREWRQIRASEVNVDDMVQGIGRVAEVEFFSGPGDARNGWVETAHVVITNISEQTFSFEGKRDDWGIPGWHFPEVTAFVEAAR